MKVICVFYLWHYAQEGRKEMFYLMTPLTQNVRGNWQPPHGLGLPARVLLYAHPTDRIAHITAFVMPVMEHNCNKK